MRTKPNSFKGVAAALALAATVSCVSAAKADDVQFSISGAGVTASGTLYGSYVTVFGFSDPLFEATGATGFFSDSTSGVHGTINGVYPGSVYSSVPSNGNHDSINAVGVPYPPASYDNIVYVKGNSPVVCDPTFYPYHGGFMDIYGVMLTLNTGTGTGLVNVWSNGNLNDPSNPIGIDYGLSDGMLTMIGTTPTFNVLNYIGNGNNYPAYSGSGLTFSAHTPEPSAAAMFTIGLLTLPALRLRRRFKKTA